MKPVVPAFATLLLASVASANLGGVLRIGSRLVKGGIEAANDASNDSQNNNSRRTVAVPFGDAPPEIIADANDHNEPRGYIYAREPQGSVDSANDHDDLHGYIYAREEDPFAGLPEPAASTCKKDLKNTVVKYRVINNNSVRFDNIPATCMTLANVFLGQNKGGAAPIPMGNASLRYDNVSQEQIKELRETFKK